MGLNQSPENTMTESPFLVALRVLGRVGSGLEPSAADKAVLRKAVAPGERNLSMAELSSIVCKRELKMSKKFSKGSGEKGLDNILKLLRREQLELAKIITSLESIRAVSSVPSRTLLS